MNVAIFSAGFLPAESQGGVPFSAYNLAASLSSEGHSVNIVSTDRNGESRLNIPKNVWTKYDGLNVFYCKTYNGPYVFLKCRLHEINKLIQSVDLVISSSTLWNHMGIVVAYYAWRHKKKHFVYPRGLLDTWALKSKPFRKYIFRISQGKLISKLSSAFIALNASESKSISKIYPSAKVFIIPNGCPKNNHLSDDDRFLTKSLWSHKNYLLFLGRVSQKKGLEQTLQAFDTASPRASKLLVIAGPVDKSYQIEFNEMLKKFDSRIVVLPAVYGLQKKELFLNARAFILTSKSEGMPMAALEAMSYGKPVILTTECNIPEVMEHNAGWLVHYGDVESTRNAIESCFDCEDEYQVKSKNAICISNNIFSWSKIAKKTIDVANTNFT